LDEAAADATAALASAVVPLLIGTTPAAMPATFRLGSSFTALVDACRFNNYS